MKTKSKPELVPSYAGKQVFTLKGLGIAAEQGKQVVSSALLRAFPAEKVLAQSGNKILGYIRAGLYERDPKKAPRPIPTTAHLANEVEPGYVQATARNRKARAKLLKTKRTRK